jgi:hypothetical protein
MAIVKTKPTSPGAAIRRAGQDEGCTRVRPCERWSRRRARRAVATTPVASRPGIRAVVTSSATASSTSSVTSMACPGPSSGSSTIPNRTAHIALIKYADGERRYIIAPSGLKGRRRVGLETSADLGRQRLPLRNIPVGTGALHRAEDPARALSWRAAPARRCSWSPVKAITPPCVCVRRDAQGACRLPRHVIGAWQRRAQSCASSGRPAPRAGAVFARRSAVS